MSSAFSAITFTSNVKAQQSKMGSRSAYAAHEQTAVDEAVLGPAEAEFIAARDSFYLGTVGESGWPYVQHRGGPAGFLKVLDAHTIGFADYTGNRQYISTGNIAGDNRVSLFLMDYPNQTRLKILGRTEVVTEESNPDLFLRLQDPHYRARVERGMVIHIEGFDWNCPKYITPRFTQDEVARQVKVAVAELAVTRDAQVGSESESGSDSDSDSAIGNGELELSITGVRDLTRRVRAYELRALDWDELPAASPGAHIEVPVRLGDGTLSTRQYSLTTSSGPNNVYEIAVLQEDSGRGGSQAIRQTWKLGSRLRVSPPINHFPLHDDVRPAVLIAGGIGITPIKAMAEALKARDATFEIHYTAKTPADMAFHHVLQAGYGPRYSAYFSRAPGGRRLDVDAVMQAAASDAVFYVCGPVALIEAVLAAATRIGIEPGRVQYESFY